MTLRESKYFDDDAQTTIGPTEYINYAKMRKQIQVNGCTGEADPSASLLRVKPWEAYKAQEQNA